MQLARTRHPPSETWLVLTHDAPQKNERQIAGLLTCSLTESTAAQACAAHKLRYCHRQSRNIAMTPALAPRLCHSNHRKHFFAM